MKRLAMIANEFSPYRCDGGLGIAVERLGLQLAEIGEHVSVYFPSEGEHQHVVNHPSSLVVAPIATSGPHGTEVEFAAALTSFCSTSADCVKAEGAEYVVAHDNEMALGAVLCAQRGIPTVFWLHSLYDHPSRGDYPANARSLLSSPSVMASAIASADVVVASSGVLKDAVRIAWPARLRDVQAALLHAVGDKRVLTVESTGCLPKLQDTPVRPVATTSYGFGSRPYVLFASRPVVSKGIGFYQSVAERMRSHGIDFVAVGSPAPEIRRHCRDVIWIPWLPQIKLYGVMSQALAIVHPSITEGYGLSAAESSMFNKNVLCHAVGGLQALIAEHLAVGIQVTDRELRALYELWSDLLDTDSGEYWKIWQRYEERFDQLIGQWVEQLSLLVSQTKDAPTFREVGTSPWGQTISEKMRKLDGC